MPWFGFVCYLYILQLPFSTLRTSNSSQYQSSEVATPFNCASSSVKPARSPTNSTGPVTGFPPKPAFSRANLSTTGFTPIKLPYQGDDYDPVMGIPGTPALSALGSPFSNFSMPEVCSDSLLQFRHL